MSATYFSAIAGNQKVDGEAGIISGVSVITRGEASGHGFLVDEKTLQQFADFGNKAPSGVKVMLKHFKAGESSPVTDTVAYLKNFRVDGDNTRADLNLLKSDTHFGKIIELAQKLPTEFGLSVSFDKKIERVGGKDFVRVNELHSVDLVDAPAANPTGLFSEPHKENQNITMNIETAKLAKALSLPDGATEAEVESALLAKLSAKQPDITALETKITEASTKLTQLSTAADEAAKAAKKTEIAALVAEASRTGKVIPLTNEQLEKMDVQTVKEMLTKISPTVQLSRKPLTPEKDGKKLEGEALRAWMSERRSEGATQLNSLFNVK